VSALSPAQAPWLTAPPSRAVIAALEAAGGAGCARFVGGCVRNALVGQGVDDIDIATRLTPDRVIAGLKAAGLKAVPTGLAHGTVTAVALGSPLEVTTLRRDVETDGRRAVVVTDDWAEDAARRDFRLNALYADPSGVIFDPTGQGVADALAGRIVFVGDPQTRIAEDALRILRFFRFEAWFGRDAPDAAALAACAAMKDRIARLSAERISKELLKLLAAPDPRAAMRLMARCGVLDAVLPDSIDPGRFERLVEIEEREGFAPDPLSRLAALLRDDPATAIATATRLRLSNPQRDRLATALGGGEGQDVPDTPPAARRLIYRLGPGSFRDRLLLAWASPTAAGVDWRAVLSSVSGWSAPAFPLSGEDALASGLAQGPTVGEALRALEAEWVGGDFSQSREALLQRLRDMARSPGP
jgi:poly(A) polymerase